MSDEKSKIAYEFLTYSENFLFTARENGKTHSAFQNEVLLFNAIKNGDLTELEKTLELYKKEGLVIGHISNNPVRAIHYWAVSTIAVAIHYAILGGLDESEAYRLSDIYILEIDKMDSMEECIDYLFKKSVELTSLVRDKKIPSGSSALITKALHFININLHSRLKIEDIAQSLYVSRDYLSARFKKETGISIHEYILDKKLDEAKTMLLEGKSIYDVSYTLNFCNESHFIRQFKKKFNTTPQKFLEKSCGKSMR